MKPQGGASLGPVRRLLAALLALFPAACAPVDLLNALVPIGGVEIARDIPYGRNPRQKLDVYRPRGQGVRPLVVFFYGGAWQTGSKALYRFAAAALARRGMTVVVPDYRIHPEVSFPGFIEDAAAAVAWARVHAGDHGGNTRGIFVTGHSAGAYLAAMLALDGRYLAAAGMARADLAGAIGISGPYDFLPLTRADLKPIFEVVPDPAVTQPISFADGTNPPMLLITGQADATVLPRNTLALAARIRAKGGPVETRVYTGIGHIGTILALAPLFGWRAPVLDDISDFVARTAERRAGERASARD